MRCRARKGEPAEDNKLLGAARRYSTTVGIETYCINSREMTDIPRNYEVPVAACVPSDMRHVCAKWPHMHSSEQQPNHSRRVP